nr:glycoside hydrolase family 43 protein [Eubacterium sp.]
MKKTMKKLAGLALSGVLTLTATLSPSSNWTAMTAQAASTPSRVAVHDPSIAVGTDGTYYVFGSHMATASSEDLINWTQISTDYQNKTNNSVYGNITKNFAKPFSWAGENDMDCSGGHAIWAPDVVYNEDYVNTDGSKGAYMMYFCTSSTAVRSVIGYAISDKIQGPYTVVDTIVYSGFSKSDAYDSDGTKQSKINKNYTNTNIDELIADGTLKDGVNSKWFSGSSGFNNTLYPNAIDPNIFRDTEGRMWMSYGSWSGGIYILELDPATGKAIYPGKSSTSSDGHMVDEYFGTKIAGGFRKSGEAPYILYDKESKYYYMYMSYEFLTQKSGYNMRLFRSKSPDGPYVDAAGNDAVLATSTTSHSNVGIKVMGNYDLPYIETAYMAEGHNSALIDSKTGNRYLVYHTRFETRGEAHQVRVHQQFMNAEGWPVTAVYENKGDVISSTGYDTTEIVGQYHFIDHKTNNDGANIKSPATITLNKDGSISGDATGTWSQTANSYLATFTIDKVKYSGVFFKQTVETSSKKVMTFTAIGTNNHTIWGSQKPLAIESTASTLYVGGNTGKTAKLSISGV